MFLVVGLWLCHLSRQWLKNGDREASKARRTSSNLSRAVVALRPLSIRIRVANTISSQAFAKQLCSPPSWHEEPQAKNCGVSYNRLLPASTKGGARKLAVSDEAALNGILFVLQTGIPWEDLPQSLGYGSGMTCCWRLRDWNAAGVWERLHQAILTRLREHNQIDWSWVSIDGSWVPSLGGRRRSPTRRTEASLAPSETTLLTPGASR